MTTIDSPSFELYAKIAQLVYFVNDVEERNKRIANLGRRDCQVDLDSIRSETSRPPFKFDAFQAMCVIYGQKLVVAYRGTNKERVEDLTVDVGIVNICATPTSGAMLRSLIERETGKKTWFNWLKSESIRRLNPGILMPFPFTPPISDAVFNAHIDGLAGRLVCALEYYNKWVNPRRNQFSEIIVVGHSLGGLIASHVAYKNNTIAHTFDSAPGVKYTLAENSRDVDGDKASKIFNHRTIGDPISASVGLNDQGYPYGHMGYIFNWRSPDSCSGLDCHQLDQLIKTKFESQYLDKSAAAPTTKVFW